MGSRDHSITCALCGVQRGGLDDYKCECDDLVDSGAVTREFADRARQVAEARDEACRRWEQLRHDHGLDYDSHINELRDVGQVS